MRSANPILERRFEQGMMGTGEAMDLSRTVNKTGLLLAIAAIVALWPWRVFQTSGPAATTPFLWVGIIGGLIPVFALMFRPQWAGFLAPVYAIAEGLFLGAISVVLEASYPGIALQAIAGTIGVLALMLIAYQSGLVRPTERFKLGVIAATGGIFVVYLATMVLSLFGVNTPFLHGSGTFAIGFNIFVIGVAALNLVLDFDMIRQLADRRAPKYMEWYGAFALMVTLVWLYIETLRLLSKLRSRN